MAALTMMAIRHRTWTSSVPKPGMREELYANGKRLLHSSVSSTISRSAAAMKPIVCLENCRASTRGFRPKPGKGSYPYEPTVESSRRYKRIPCCFHRDDCSEARSGPGCRSGFRTPGRDTDHFGQRQYLPLKHPSRRERID